MLYDEIERRLEEAQKAEDSENSKEPDDSKNLTNVSQIAKSVHHTAIFDAFNEALDLERPYKFKGQPNPWSKQTRLTNESLSSK